MPRSTLIDLDVDKLFEEKSVDEIIEIEKLINGEIDKKRSELRSMVGDRYKDILAASDAIKSMKTISEDIVKTIDQITNTCKILITAPDSPKTNATRDTILLKRKNEERTLIIQLRLAISLNEQIWIAIEEEDNLIAAQHCLLAQHIYMGLDLTDWRYLENIHLLEHLKQNLSSLKSKVFRNISEKLEYMEINSDEASKNLNALMLLENQTGLKILEKCIEHRKAALDGVISSQHPSIRLLVMAVIRCLLTSVILFHDCFIKAKEGKTQNNEDYLNIQMPVTPLLSYIPDVVRQYRPQSPVLQVDKLNAKGLVNNWLLCVKQSVEEGLKKSLQSVTTVKALQLIREEYNKIKMPENWIQICVDLHFPESFDMWQYFLQDLLTSKAKSLISSIISRNTEEIKSDVTAVLQKIAKTKDFEVDLRSYAWTEEHSDVDKADPSHTGLTMKTKGFSQNFINLCGTVDSKYLALLKDVSPYLYGVEVPDSSSNGLVATGKCRKYVDGAQLENHLAEECISYSLRLPAFIEEQISTDMDVTRVSKSLFFARFLGAACEMCTSFVRSCQFNGDATGWNRVCRDFLSSSDRLWGNWVDACVKVTVHLSREMNDTSPKKMIRELYKWDEIEIQEQTEEKTFKSHIRVPLRPSVSLVTVLAKLNADLAQILPFTLPNSIHDQFLMRNSRVILAEYEKIVSQPLNQITALQFLFDVRFFVSLCVPRENVDVGGNAQRICDELRQKIDPFDLDVFYSYLQSNVKKAVGQLQTMFGGLVPYNAQPHATETVPAKHKSQEITPSLLALSKPSSDAWFPLLPITGPSHKVAPPSGNLEIKEERKAPGKTLHESLSSRQLATSIFGGIASDWFS
ncbi:conserved oligomeric Golgi complex subunit 1-like [Cylas formicarius]|uniref:conserved oligomeric Golgi complex subunit 1-like n=1 Tax=Cylas formicarius TaxID=197179 RepID=UPI002958549D|nr:conserved oligomeric Golgi complex subunit 1-like [Cylas formicarius]